MVSMILYRSVSRDVRMDLMSKLFVPSDDLPQQISRYNAIDASVSGPFVIP